MRQGGFHRGGIGAVIGSEAFKVAYTKLLVDDWIKQLNLLSKIAETEPQSAYSPLVGGFKRKLAYVTCKISSSGDLLKSLKDVIRFNFILAINGDIYVR